MSELPKTPITGLDYRDVALMIDSASKRITDDFALRLSQVEIHILDKVKHSQERALENKADLKVFKSNVYSKFDSIMDNMYTRLDRIEKTLVDIEFKHNWKTALWVAIGAATGSKLSDISSFLPMILNMIGVR
jgi:hypothetical protein